MPDSTILRFSMTRLVCASMPCGRGASGAAGSVGIWPVSMTQPSHSTAWLNGARVVLNLPPGFVWNNPGGDEDLTATDYSQGRAFKGTWDWVFAANGSLSYDTVVSLAGP